MWGRCAAKANLCSAVVNGGVVKVWGVVVVWGRCAGKAQRACCALAAQRGVKTQKLRACAQCCQTAAAQSAMEYKKLCQTAVFHAERRRRLPAEQTSLKTNKQPKPEPKPTNPKGGEWRGGGNEAKVCGRGAG